MSETKDERDEEIEQTDTGATPEPINPEVPAEQQGLTEEAVGQPPDPNPREEGDKDAS